jgi:hypothetical protein
MSKLAKPKLENTETLSAINGDSLNLFTDTFSRCMKNANATGSELVRFMNDRFKKDLQIASRFAECRQPQDFFALQSELITTLIGDYAQETSRLVGMLTATSDDIARASLVTS